MTTTLKRLGLFFLVGVVLGDVLAMVLGPPAVTWFQSPALGGALCECAKVTEETARSLIKVQLISMVSGGVALTFVSELLYRLWRRRTPTPSTPPTT